MTTTIRLVEGREILVGPNDRLDAFLSLWPGEERHPLLDLLPLLDPERNTPQDLELAELVRCFEAGAEFEEGEEEP